MRKLLTGVEGRRLLSAMIALTFCLSAMLGLLIASSSDWIDTEVRESPTAAKTLALTLHDPIYIDGNDGFAGPNASTGVTRGSGTEVDPYVIEGWDINASTANGIEIQNTDAHFIVRSCYVHDGAWNNGTRYGIYLRYCLNGTLDGNNCSNDAQGIYLDHSSNNILTNNTCSNCEVGLGILFSSGNNVSNNTCSSNTWYGLVLFRSSSNTVNNNSCSNNRNGIFHDHSDSNTLSKNTCNSNSYNGIYFQSSNGVTLSNNTCSSNNWNGMWFVGPSSGNTVSNNTMSNNNLYGLSMFETLSSNTIWNNTFVCNNGATDVYNPFHIQACDNGTSSSWNSTDGYGNYWSDWITPDNDTNGIVDYPYLLDGTAGAKDYYPLTTTPVEPIPEFSSILLVAMVLLTAIVLAERARERKAE